MAKWIIYSLKFRFFRSKCVQSNRFLFHQKIQYPWIFDYNKTPFYCNSEFNISLTQWVSVYISYILYWIAAGLVNILCISTHSLTQLIYFTAPLCVRVWVWACMCLRVCIRFHMPNNTKCQKIRLLFFWNQMKFFADFQVDQTIRVRSRQAKIVFLQMEIKV